MSGISNDALLATLVAQAEGKCLDLVTLRAMVEESSQAGARRALGALGLDDAAKVKLVNDFGAAALLKLSRIPDAGPRRRSLCSRRWLRVRAASAL